MYKDFLFVFLYNKINENCESVKEKFPSKVFRGEQKAIENNISKNLDNKTDHSGVSLKIQNKP